jgi:hypothetical protein
MTSRMFRIRFSVEGHGYSIHTEIRVTESVTSFSISPPILLTNTGSSSASSYPLSSNKRKGLTAAHYVLPVYRQFVRFMNMPKNTFFLFFYEDPIAFNS